MLKEICHNFSNHFRKCVPSFRSFRYNLGETLACMICSTFFNLHFQLLQHSRSGNAENDLVEREKYLLTEIDVFR